MKERIAIKKIVLLIPSLQIGGMERVMNQLIHYFATIPSLELYLVMYGRNPLLSFVLPANVEISKPKFLYHQTNRLFYSIKSLLFIRREVKRIKPDTILSFGEYWNSYVILSLLGLNYPLYISDRCQPDKKLKSYHEKLRKWLYPSVSGVILQTEIAKDIYQKAYNLNNIHVIGNPFIINVSQSNEVRQKIILSVGRLIESKHFDRLISTFLKLNAPDWKLIIIGGDALKQSNLDKLRELVKSNQAEGRIELLGNQTDVQVYYNQAKIFAFMSSSEGFPNVIGEALIAGLPVVAYDCIAGPSDMIKHGVNGYLVPLFQEDLFLNYLKQLTVDDDKIRLFSEQAPLSMYEFSLEKIGKKYLSILLNEASAD